MTDQPKRQGPRVLPVVLECPGCAHEDGALYCAHPDVIKERGRPRMRECTRVTPKWCPMLPATTPNSDASKLDAIGKLLSQNGCDCDCDHAPEDHDDDCELCLACRIGAVVAR